ncbi:Gfo/Idh/MocA family oxidoreductase [Mesorhizobium sp. AD1-1]|uniref:Gfo/Idh/MocA family protein n=1 Tax=Mesorhizobium sp. AD1-1 TaxID=2876621 RepID=UPI001CCE6DDA|nr:Gfo/Idh/MocA family oxidoreductase [Mesorhizobium sp. AD1-1]MBZ9719240.1 Gfo/Idh/MocA family oxidoreductase [Mesorhizobium sp. AD1-1]
MRFGIVGCGMMGQLYAEKLTALGHVVSAACDPDLARAETVVGKKNAYADHRVMFASGEVDVACICSPTPYHCKAVLDAAEFGLDVFVEKPMATSLAEALRMSAAVAAAGRRIGFGLKMRFEAIFDQTNQLIRNGEIGNAVSSTMAFYQPVPPGERIWYVDVGVLRDMLVHTFDLAIWMNDALPDKTRATTLNRLGRAGEDWAEVDIVFEGGARAHIHGGYMPRFPNIAGHDDIAFHFVGERGYILGKRPNHLLLVNAKGIRMFDVSPVDAFSAELASFAEALRTGSQLPVSDKQGLEVQAIIALAETSAATDSAWVR